MSTKWISAGRLHTWRGGWSIQAVLGIVVSCALILCLPAAGQEASVEGVPIVRKITVTGTYLVQDQLVRNLLNIQVGKPLDREALRSSLDKIKGLGLFSEATATTSLEGGGVEVRVEVEEQLRATTVGFRGNKRISSRRLLELVAIGPGDSVTPARVGAAEEKITDAYLKAGYPLVSVVTYVQAAEAGAAPLTFDIVEGPEAYIRRIEVNGNAALSADRIRKLMKSRPRRWPGFLWPGRFSPGKFSRDLDEIANSYYQAGHLDVKVAGYLSYSEDFRTITLNVTVYEGPVYIVMGVEFEGNLLFTDDELRDAIPVKAGELFSKGRLAGAEMIIADMYGRQGHVDVGAPGEESLSADWSLAETGHSVLVRFRIEEGLLVRIRRVRIEGLTKTGDLVVRREVSIYPGDRARTDKLAESERQLRNTGYFDPHDPNAVRITLEPDVGALRDAVVRVNEGQTGLLMLGAGVSSDAGILGQIMIREDNFDIMNWPRSWRDLFSGNALRGAGQRLTMEIALGTERSTYVLALEDPSIHHGPYGLGGQIYRRGVQWDEFDVTRTGLAVKLTKMFTRYVRGELRAGYEGITMDDLSGSASPAIVRDKGNYSKAFVAASYIVDRRDSRFIPTTGYRAKLEAELATLDINTLKLTGSVKKYWTVWQPEGWGKHILSARVGAGLLWGYSGDRSPVFERFYADGADSIRGFALWGISPVEPTREQQVGGDSRLIGSLEYSVPVSGDRLRLAAFVDGGYVAEDASDILTGWDELRAAVGVGARWQIPFLANTLLSVDVAFPVKHESFDDTQPVTFSFGTRREF
ncbi:MAG: outer membrane protein assembly factor BamA [Candidatus Brocadiia bacterium]|nr:outer membrane protein assembly factor BamA [Candidatus Brocadiia bacterium]